MFAAMEREQHLDEILGDYLAAADAGQAGDRRELLAGHPDLETELTEFFTELDRLDRLTAPIRPAQPPDLCSLLDLDAPLPPFPGDYELLEVLGQGGMGVVYKARDTKLDRLVALKMIRAGWLATREHVRRFQNEARTAAKLDHPHIVPIHEVGEVNGQPFYTMKLVEGRNLAERLEDFRLPLADSKTNNKGWPGLRYSKGWPGLRYSEGWPGLRYSEAPDERVSPSPGLRSTSAPATQTPTQTEINNRKSTIASLMITLARAVHHAHQRGILHRDLKPSNILLASGGRKPPDTSESSGGSRPPLADLTPYIADFGLARGIELDSHLTNTGAIVGTPTYMAPEQAEFTSRARPLTTAADIYSLGAILYTLLTGRPPFQGGNVLDTLEQVRTHEPPAPRTVNPLVDRDLESICLKCLEKNPDRRYESAEALARDLERWQEGKPVHARPPSVINRLNKWGWRHQPLVGAALIILLLSVVGLGVSTYLIAGKHAEVVRGRDEAGRQRDRAQKTTEEIRQHLYVAHMAQAFRAWQAHDHEGMLAFLDRQRPDPEQTDLRGFEWRLLQRLGRTTPHPERTLRGHLGEVYCLAFAPDGHTLASAGMDGKVCFWDSATGEKRPKCLEHPTEVNWMAYSPSGKLLATACDQGIVKIWDVATREALKEFKAHDDKTVVCVAFSPDESILASSASDRTVKYWSVGTYQPVTTLPQEATGQFVAFAPDGTSWCTADGDRVLLWDSKSHASRHVFNVTGKAVLNVKYSHDSRIIAAAAEDGIIRRWETDTGRSLPDLVHGAAVQTVAFSQDDRTLASGGDDAVIRIWDLASNVEEMTLRGHRSRVWCLAYSPDGNWLTSCGHDQSIKVWQPARFREKNPLSLPAANPGHAAFTSDGQLLVTHNVKGDVEFWEMGTGRLRSKLPIPLGEIGTIASSPTERLLALCRIDETIQLWNLETNKPDRVLEGAAASVRGASFSPDGKHLAVALDKGLGVWNVASGRRENLFSTDWQGCRPAFSPDGKVVAGVSDQSAVGLWNVETGAKIASLRSQLVDHISSLAFSPDGSLLAVGFGATVKLWDLAGQVEKNTLVCHENMAGLLLAFSTDGKTLASGGGKEGKIILWSVATSQEILTLDSDILPLWALTFSPDGNDLAAAGGWANDAEHPSKLLIWRADPDQAARALRRGQ